MVVRQRIKQFDGEEQLHRKLKKDTLGNRER